MNCICGHTDLAHSRPIGLKDTVFSPCILCPCAHLENETSVIFTAEEKKEWTAIKKRVGLKKARTP